VAIDETSVEFVHLPCAPRYRKNSLLGRVFGQVVLSLCFVVSIVRNVRRKDVLFSGTNPTLLLPVIGLLRPLLGFKWMLLVHDVFPESLIPAGILKADSTVYRALKVVFDRAYGSCDALISIGRDMCAILAKKSPSTVRIDYVPNWVDVDQVTAPETLEAALQAKDEVAGTVRFQFFGNLGRVQGIDVLLDAVSRMTSSAAKVTFVGGGAAQGSVLSYIDKNPNGKVSWQAAVPFERNNEILFDCDISIASLTQGMFGLGVPSKAYFSLAADRKLLVVGDVGSELHLLILENPAVGWFCESGDAEGLAKTMDLICDGMDLASRGRSRSLVLEGHSPESAIKAIAVAIVGTNSRDTRP
jgi:glycosyltransferase involved in cell wall biosynthesis